MDPNNPLEDLEHWEEDLLRRYPSPRIDSGAGTQNVSPEFRPEPICGQADKKADQYRDYAAETRPSVKLFYELNHRHQTLDFVRQKREQFLQLDHRRMGIWEAMNYLNQLVDDSDPDIELPQIEHLLQTAEAIRATQRPDWYVLAGLIHDLGKILCLWGEPQWAVVGDTFPVGCRFSEKIVYHEAFSENPDTANPIYSTPLGIYQAECGLDQVLLSWGHDEYLYHVVKDYLPLPALYMIRYHSCYPIHREAEYQHLLNDQDREMLPWVQDFNQFDLYTKRDERMDVERLRPYYEQLIERYFPPQLAW